MLNNLQAYHQPQPVVEEPAAPRYSKSRSRRAPTPPSESDSEYSSSGSESSSGSSSYLSDADEIYNHVVEKKKCAYVSPAGLREKSSAKDAIQHLKKKNCPEVPALKKSARVAPAPAPAAARAATPAPAPSAPASPLPAKRKIVKKNTDQPPKVVEEAPAPAPAAAAPAAAAKKAKRAPTPYNIFVGQQLKAGKAMTEVARLWKEKKGAST